MKEASHKQTRWPKKYCVSISSHTKRDPKKNECGFRMSVSATKHHTINFPKQEWQWKAAVTLNIYPKMYTDNFWEKPFSGVLFSLIFASSETNPPWLLLCYSIWGRSTIKRQLWMGFTQFIKTCLSNRLCHFLDHILWQSLQMIIIHS